MTTLDKLIPEAGRFDSSLIQKYDRPVPRYTSYPTAVQFGSDYGPQLKREDLTAAATIDEPLSVYIHLPFCASICLFCGCNVTPTRDRRRSDRYLDYLEKEMDLTFAHLGRNRAVDQLHFGGGSPTFFSPEQLARLMRALSSRLKFLPGAEISIECNPRETSLDHLKMLSSLGFNRLSFGVQDINPEVQEAVNRIEPESLLEPLFKNARELGFESLSFDLIYGLPKQTPESFAHSLQRILQWRPDRLALFHFAYLPDRIARQKALDASAMPSAEEKQRIFEESLSTLSQWGYRHIGLDHFALPGDTLSKALDQGALNRNFQGYHAKPSYDLLGMGVSSISNTSNSYSQNHKTIALWESLLDSGNLPVERGVRVTDEDRFRKEIIHGILCRNQVDLAEVATTYQRNHQEVIQWGKQRTEELVRDDLVRWEGSTLCVTNSGRMWSRNIASVFDAYLEGSAGAVFSRSV
ncbi:MAG: oxygen-independent coproporphyrinogen III oxidase [Candidatus Methylacidiphilales bacterium]